MRRIENVLIARILPLKKRRPSIRDRRLFDVRHGISLDAPKGVAMAAMANHTSDDSKLTVEQLKVIAKLRQVTTRFHDVDAAVQAGYVEQFPAGCATSPAGAQGFHHLNPTLAEDGVIDPLTPELLMYEPAPNGRLELVGVDYIICESVAKLPQLPQ